MRLIFTVVVVIILLIITFGYDLFEKIIMKKNKPKSQSKDLDDLEKEVEEKTESYNEVIDKVEDSEKKIDSIKKKIRNKK
jgi:peptidoglycan hydrolase CwlO-like protein